MKTKTKIKIWIAISLILWFAAFLGSTYVSPERIMIVIFILPPAISILLGLFVKPVGKLSDFILGLITFWVGILVLMCVFALFYSLSPAH